MTPVSNAIEATRIALEENTDANWLIGFSGGKDSTAMLCVIVAALKKCSVMPRSVELIYCDTGVENPVLDRYVKSLCDRLTKEFEHDGLPLQIQILSAPVEQRFFTKLIGRGYPSPTNSFRWCTKNLRINPVAKYIAEKARENAIVALGMRRDESEQRKRSIQKNGDERWQVQREAKSRYRVFLPVLEMTVSDVWDTIYFSDQPNSIDSHALERLYRDASGECPIIKSPQAPPCGSGRFGCWTCTVVRQDKSAKQLIAAGYEELIPFLQFRNWLTEIRNEPDLRWPVRRNGRASMGPFTLAARRMILATLENLERETETSVVGDAERAEIERLWALDVPLEAQILA